MSSLGQPGCPCPQGDPAPQEPVLLSPTPRKLSAAVRPLGRCGRDWGAAGWLREDDWEENSET